MQGRLSRPAKDRWSELGFELPFKGSVCSTIPTKILATTATTTEHFSEEYNTIQSLNNIIFTISKAEFKLTHPSKKQATMTPPQGKNYQWRLTLMMHLVDFKARIQILCSMTKGTYAHKELKCGIRCCKGLVRWGAEEEGGGVFRPWRKPSSHWSRRRGKTGSEETPSTAWFYQSCSPADGERSSPSAPTEGLPEGQPQRRPQLRCRLKATPYKHRGVSRGAANGAWVHRASPGRGSEQPHWGLQAISLDDLSLICSSASFFFFFWLRCSACGILVPWPGIESPPSAVKVPSPNHWTTREFPCSSASYTFTKFKIAMTPFLIYWKSSCIFFQVCLFIFLGLFYHSFHVVFIFFNYFKQICYKSLFNIFLSCSLRCNSYWIC